MSSATRMVFWLPLLLVFSTSAVSSQLHPSALDSSEWPAYSGPSGARYSALSQIRASNVDRLRPAWEWSSESVLGEESEFRNQSTPLMVDGVLYFTAGRERVVIAADARTGETRWVWRADEGERAEIAPRANSGRGVSYWSDGEESRIFVVTPGYHLVALDATTGDPVQSFGEGGTVDLKRVLGAPDDAVIGASSPAAVYEDVLIIGPALAVGLAPPSRENVKGSVLAVDARTGKERWRFDTIPGAGEFGNETWENDSWRYTGNAGVWAPITVDHDRGLVFLPVEAATGDYYGGHRLGENLFSSSLVALEAETGERVWHFQMVHHDVFDYDNPTAPLLADITVEGRQIPAVVQLTKQAFAFVFNRETGAPLWPIEERVVPQSDLPGERTSPTQPFPTKPLPYDRLGITVDDLIDFTPELRAEALEAIKPFRLGGAFAPGSAADAADGTIGTLTMPGTLGGTNWEGGAFDPSTGLLFVGSHSSPVVLTLVNDPQRSDMDFIMPGGRVPRIQGLPIVSPPYSRVTAIDLTTGDHAWMVPAGDAPEEIRNHPALASVDVPPTGTPGARPVLLATATLLIAGEGSGGLPYLHLLEKQTGEELHRIELGGPVTSVPMSYEVDGKQYIAFWIANPVSDLGSTLVSLSLAAE